MMEGFQDQKTCVDDTVIYDDSIEQNFYRVCEFLEISSRGGCTFNPKKFQFGSSEVNFLGFRVTENGIKPLLEVGPAVLCSVRGRSDQDCWLSALDSSLRGNSCFNNPDISRVDPRPLPSWRLLGDHLSRVRLSPVQVFSLFSRSSESPDLRLTELHLYLQDVTIVPNEIFAGALSRFLESYFKSAGFSLHDVGLPPGGGWRVNTGARAFFFLQHLRRLSRASCWSHRDAGDGGLLGWTDDGRAGDWSSQHGAGGEIGKPLENLVALY